jgi:hypothetical protein
MTLKRIGAVCLTLAVSAPLAAQQGQRQSRGMGMQAERGSMQNRGQKSGPAQLLSLRETLELTDDQIGQLETLEEGFAEQREARRAQAQEMREQVRSGDVPRNDIREQAAARREAGQATSAAHKQMVEQVLTDEQSGKLTEMRAANQQHRSGRAGMRGRGQRGQRQGVRGRQGFQRGRQGFQRGRQGFQRGRQGVQRGRRGGPPLGGDGLG